MTRFTVDSDAVDSAAAAIGATVSRLQGEVSALHGQLDALQSSASATLVATRNQDVDALMTQGSFLSTKFSGSDLDL